MTQLKPEEHDEPEIGVLTVDDNPAVRRVLSELFSSDGFTVYGNAADGQEAVDFAKRKIPDLIVLDLSMPVMNGFQAAPQLRTTLPTRSFFSRCLVAKSTRRMQQVLGIDLVLSRETEFEVLVSQARSLVARYKQC